MLPETRRAFTGIMPESPQLPRPILLLLLILLLILFLILLVISILIPLFPRPRPPPAYRDRRGRLYEPPPGVIPAFQTAHAAYILFPDAPPKWRFDHEVSLHLQRRNSQ
jgi:hypothetical protein